MSLPLFNAKVSIGSHLSLARIGRNYLWSVPAVTVLGLVASVLEGLGIGLIAPLVASLTATDSTPPPGPFQVLMRFGVDLPASRRLGLLCAAIVGLIVLKNIIAYLNTVLMAWVDGRASHDVRVALARQLLAAEYSFLLVEPPGRIVNILSTESWKASEAIRAFFQMLSSGASFALFGVLLLWSEWRLGLVVGLALLVIRFILAPIARHVTKLSQRMSAENEHLASAMMIIVLAMRPIRLFGQEARERTRFEAASETVRTLIFEMEWRSALAQPLSEVLRTCLFALLLASTFSLAADISLPILITVLVLLQRMQPHLGMFEAARTKFSQTSGSVQEVEWLLAATEATSVVASGTLKPSFEQSIQFDEVSFFYDRGCSVPTIDRASFTLHAGSSIAMIGPSGSGKSTIINLLCGLFQPNAGTIFVDGQPLERLDRGEWLGLIGFAGQDADIIEGTVADNIAYGAPGASRAAIEEAARAADADSFIRSLPNTYDTYVGSRGLNLSGGQRQRIGLARALIRKPKLLILDEATSAVDGLSEATIMDLLEAQRGSFTVLVVSHRESTLARCDSAITLRHGQVVQTSRIDDIRFSNGTSPLR